ncbi:MAG: hypothetical protein HKN46_02545 [Acidimicrobiia bacterium]|nr:hypothetical protein [Acidimicrobiia bacterium]
MPLRLTLLLFSLSALAGCRSAGSQSEASEVPSSPLEAEVQLLPLTGPCAERDAEISSLAWFGDDLVLLPQYPGRFSVTTDTLEVEGEERQTGALCVLAKAELIAFVEGRYRGALHPRLVPFESAGLAREAEGYEGYEAIAFQGDRVYLAIESDGTEAMQGYLVQGTARVEEGRLAGVRLNTRSLVPLPAQTRLHNLSYETLLVTPRGILALQEANGVAVNPTPEAYLFDPALHLRDSLDVPTLEYRLTDATTLDAEGRFWGLNYFYPGDQGTLRPGPDSLELLYGTGWTHQREAVVERLVEFRLDGDRIVRTERPPIPLRLLGENRARNWEGIARLDDLGFILATDTYPATILAFVAVSD